MTNRDPSLTTLDTSKRESKLPLVPLGQIAAVKLGKMLDRSKHKSGRKLPYLRNINVRWGNIDTSDLAEMFFKDAAEEDKYSVRHGDVLVCEGGEPGRASVWTGGETELKYQKALHRVRFHEPYEPKLLVYFLEWMASTGRLEEFFTGSTIKHFTREAFVQLPVPNPPLPEQRRIVARIEELFSRLDAGVAALRQAKAQLQRYRQSVLAAAVTGQLTQAWREQHPDTESAKELLERILKQRREQWNGRGKFRVQGAIPIDGMPEIPSSWVWAPVASICELENGDRGKNYPSRSTFTPLGIPFINAGHLESGTIQMNEMNYIPEDRFELLGSGKIEIGDLLFCLRGSLGKCAINAHLEKGAIASSLVILRSNRNVEKRFFLTYLQSSIASAFIKTYDNGSAQPNLSSASLAKFLVPLAPLAEQQQIVAEVEARTTAIDHLEAELDCQITRSSRLRQSVLSAAFQVKI